MLKETALFLSLKDVFLWPLQCRVCHCVVTNFPGMLDLANLPPLQELSLLRTRVLGACLPLCSSLQSSSQSLGVGIDSEHEKVFCLETAYHPGLTLKPSFYFSASRLPNQAVRRLSPMVLQSWDTMSWIILVFTSIFLKLIHKSLHVDIPLISFTREDFTLCASDAFLFWSLTWLWASLFWPASLASEVAL